MEETTDWKADILPRASDPSGTQTVWIDEERAGKNLIKSGDYVFVGNNKRIVLALVCVSLKARSQTTPSASLSAVCAHLLNMPKELSEHTISLALPSLKDNQLSFATKLYITLIPSTSLNGANSTTAPVLANFMSDMIPTLLMNTAVYTGCKIPINWYNQWNMILVTKVENKQHQTKEFQIGSSKINLEMPCFITDSTKIEILPWRDEYWRHELTLDNTTNELSMSKPKGRPLKQWKDEILLVVGGLDHVINKMTHLINFQLDFQSHALSGVGHNILLYGPHGTGKSLLATQIAKTSGLQMFFINGPEIFQKLEGDSEVMLMNIFEKARANAPSILIFDDLNSVASSRKGEIGITEKRIVTQLIEEMDKNSRLFASKKVFVIGICTDLKDIDESLVKPNRFDMTLEVSIPNSNQRLEILKVLSKKLDIVDKDEVLLKISAESHGFSGSELNNILQLAVLEASNINKEGVISEGKVVLQREHLLNAMNKIQPLSLVELNTDFKKISFDDIGGLGSVIEQVKKIIIEPLHNPTIFTRLGLKVPSGILLYGPPGTGKSMLVQAIATASGINFISIQGTELLSKYVGDTERLISKVFAKARASAPAILFIDQLEAIAPKRTLAANSSDNRALSSLLIEMQGIGKDFSEQRLLVLGATNKPEGLDDAILRPGRFDYHIFIPPPDIQGRKDILKKKLEGIQHKLSAEEIEHLAYQTGGFSGADLENLIRETAMISLRENIDNAQIEKRHVIAAQEIIKGTLPTTVTHPYNRQPATNTGFVFNL